MPKKESGREDSPLWTSSSTTVEPYEQLTAPDDLQSIVDKAVAQAANDIAERLRPYKTPVGQESLTKPLK